MLVIKMSRELVKEKTLEFIKNKLHFDETVVTDMPLKTYGLKTEEIADIIVEYSTDEEICPLIMVSCLSDEEEITEDSIDKLMDLSDMTMSEYCIITNLKEIQMYEYDGKENAYYLLNEPLTKEDIIEIMSEE